MAFQLAPLIIGGSALASVFGAIGQNKANKRMAEAQKAAEEVRAGHRRDEAAKIASRNVGALASNSADRRAYGQSSKDILLNEIAQGATAEETVNSDKDIRIMSITQQAANNKVDLIGAAFRGAQAGMSFAASYQDLFPRKG